MYLLVLLPGQLHISCNFFFDLLLKEHCTVVYDALDLRLVVHVLYKLDASVVRRNRHPFLVSLVTHVEILHITTIYPVIFIKDVK